MPDLEDYWKDLRPVDEKAEAQERPESRLRYRAMAKIANFGSSSARSHLPLAGSARRSDGTGSNKATRKVHTLLIPAVGFAIASIVAWGTPTCLPFAITSLVFVFLWWALQNSRNHLMRANDQVVQEDEELGVDESAQRRFELARLIRESRDELEQAEVEAVEAADARRREARETLEAARLRARVMRFGQTYGVSRSELQQVFAPMNAAMQDMSRQITEVSRGQAAMVEDLTPHAVQELMRTGHITVQAPSNPNVTIQHRVERSQVDEINEALEAIRNSPASSIPLPGIPPEAFDGIISDWGSSGEPPNREVLDAAIAEREAEMAKINQTLGNSTHRPSQWERLLSDDEEDGV